MAFAGIRRDPIEEKTQKLIDELKDNSDTMSVEEILGCRPEEILGPYSDPLTDLLSSHGELVIDVMEAEVEARIQIHDDLLSGSRSLDMHYKNLVDRYQPQPSRTRDVLTDMLTRVCHIMATKNPLFAFRPVGVGSHHDGTKTTQSDMDFVLVSLYRPGEDSTYRPGEDSTYRPREYAIYWPREDSTYRPGEDSTYRAREYAIYWPREDSTYRPREDQIYWPQENPIHWPREDSTHRPREDQIYWPREDSMDYCVSGSPSEVSILPVTSSDFHKRCVEGGLLNSDGRLRVLTYTHQLREELSSVMSAVCSELGLPFGGWNRPHFEHFDKNGPAWGVVVDGVSMDITPAFTAPTDIVDWDGRKVMEEIAERVSSAVSSTVSEDERSDWVNMGLLVLTDGCKLSTSLIETDVIRTVPQLQSAVKICKVYRYQFFDLPCPDLRPFYSHLEGRVFEWLVSGGCDTLLEAVPGDPDKRVVDRLGHNLKALLLLATQHRPLTLDGNILEKLETIKRRIDEKWIDYKYVDPSLKSLIFSKSPKPAVKTISFVFKSLLLDKWLKEKIITTQTLVDQVMEEYSRQVEGLTPSGGNISSDVPHPLLSSVTDGVRVVTLSSFYNLLVPETRSCRLIHKKIVQQIVSLITRHTTSPPVSDP